MKTHLFKVLNDFEQHLSHLSLANDNPLKCYEKSVQHTDELIKELKIEIVAYEFKNQKEEIYFFKHIKPHIVSKRILNKALYDIESKKPNVCTRILVDYYEREMQRLQFFFEDNKAFYAYYRTKKTNLDKSYFSRNKNRNPIHQESFSVQFDPLFSTLHDYKLAEIIAYEEVKLFLKQKLSELPVFDPKNTPYENDEKLLIWTENKNKLIQVIYAFYILKVFNNGLVDIKDIAVYLERVFHVKLGDIYGAFKDMKRLKNPFIFVLKMLESLREYR
jgi:hypothetical protein